MSMMTFYVILFYTSKSDQDLRNRVLDSEYHQYNASDDMDDWSRHYIHDIYISLPDVAWCSYIDKHMHAV